MVSRTVALLPDEVWVQLENVQLERRLAGSLGQQLTLGLAVVGLSPMLGGDVA